MSAASVLVLKGLDGANPLHFLAALGALATSDDLYPGQATLAWRQEGTRYVPRLGVPCDATAWCTQVAERVRTMVSEGGALAFDALEEITKCDAQVFREVARGALAKWPDEPWVARQLAGLGSDGCVDDDGTTQNIPLSFSNGGSGQCLLKDVRALAAEVNVTRMQRSLIDDRAEVLNTTNLNWDPADQRSGAHQWTEPEKTPKRTDPVTNVLAFLGLGLLPTVPTSAGLRTVAYVSRKPKGFVWSLWSAALRPPLVGALLGERFDADDIEQRRARLARGVLVTLRSLSIVANKRNYFSVARAV